MKILIVGSGLSGSSLARLLKDNGHDVSIIEKQNRIGGLCITEVNEDGLKYEPFGGRTFHSKNPRIINFITQFDDFNGYVHRKGMIIEGKLFPFPITKKSISNFQEKDKILKELKQRPDKMDQANFETACLSLFGKTLYDYFVRNYTAKMWGTDPKDLTAEWAPKRLELRENDADELFGNQWQGLPRNGYSFLLEKMIDGIPLRLNDSGPIEEIYDVVVTSAPIDETMNFIFGKLQYRSLKFYYKENEFWEKEDYGSINLPQHPKYIRKCNFKVLHREESKRNFIQYQEPIAAKNGEIPMYPINTKENNKIFEKYLNAICKSKNICPLGRLGLFKYLDMDKAVEVAFDMVEVVQNYLSLSDQERYQKIREIRERY
jgi:UDP-galactopyranose mutase